VENLRGFLQLRGGRAGTRPKVEVFFLMTPTNLPELPRAVELAAGLGADELVATNLDYVMTPGLDRLRAYGRQPRSEHLREALAAAGDAARKAGIAFRPYPLAFREMAVCDLNPMKILFISADGAVSPCVYTSLTGQSDMPRVFDGQALEVPVVQFGNVNDRPLAEIWESAPYREFRAQFARRVVAASGFALGALAARTPPQDEVPAPQACRTCPKLYGV
jgi:MoaA/NifB/PqqE/SkfB family radical SAM enzyme